MKNCLVAALIFAGSGLVCAQDFFPLQVGNRWEYAWGSQRPHRVIEVTGTMKEGGLTWFKVRWFDRHEHLLKMNPEGQLLEADPAGNQLVWANFSSPLNVKYLSQIQPDSHARVYSKDSSRVEILYDPLCCDRGVLHEIYIASVGLEERLESGIVPITWKLISARIAGHEMKFPQ